METDLRLVGLDDFIKQLFPEILERYGITDRYGGYLSILDIATGTWLVREQRVGRVDDPEKAAKYAGLSVEKAERLRTAIATHGHVSSRQSRDPERGRWGGAIRTQDYSDECRDGIILSFSGLPELADEAFVVALAFWMPNIGFSDVDTIAKVSDPEVNQLLLDLY